jgi:SCY1-like protein 1
MLVPLFFIAENYLDAADFSREMGPLITLLFTVNDRGIRGSLLKKAPVLIQHLNGHSLNVNVFEPMCSGFSDSSAALRELTLQATAILVPHLTQPNLEKLSRYLVRLQADTEVTIRQQTVVFFTKLAPHLSETSRHKLLLPAMIRGMKDAAAPCRLAALQATLTVKELFSPAGIASQVVPAISPCLVDASSQVRKEAFSAMEDLLFVLRRESERLSLLPEAGATTGMTAPVSGDVPMGAPAAAVTPVVAPAPSSSGGYFSSWMSSSTTPAAVPVPAAVTAATTSQASASATATPTRNIPSTSATTAMGKMSLPSADDSQGWGDDDDDDADGWGDDDLPLGGGPPARPIGVSQRTAHPSGKLHVGSSKSSVSVAKPAVLKLSVEDDVSDGWDDF